MIYDNSRVRRQDRLLDADRAQELLQIGEYGVLSVVTAGETDGQPAAYGIPVNFVWDGEDSLYIHCAPEERMNALKLLLGKYSPDDMAIGMKYAEKSFHRTEIIRLDIRSVSGKSKRVG